MPNSNPDPSSHPMFKLGKNPAIHDPRTLQMAKYLPATAIAPPPASANYDSKVASWPMMMNDTLGDCTCACAGHMIEEWTTYVGNAYTPPDAAVLKAYEAVGGYKPGQPETDRGAQVIDVLNYWRKTGLANHKILAYVSLEPKNHDQVKDAVELFGNCYLGVQLPISAQKQTVWAVPPGGPTGTGAPGSWGGHAIPVVAYDVRGLTVVTWGALKRMTWTFLDTYCDEAFAVLSQDFINKKGIAPNQFKLAELQADLQLIENVAAKAAHK